MPRGMIGAPPMPQYGMPMNGQMPPAPPMMPPMPPMPPQPPPQQGAPAQQQPDPWAGGINPSLTALMPGGAPSYPLPYVPLPTSAHASFMPPMPTAQPGPSVAPAPAIPEPTAPTPLLPQPATQAEGPAPAIQPTPIVTPGWAWPPPTTGVPIDPGALAGVQPQAAPVQAAELPELRPLAATLSPWRSTSSSPEVWPSYQPALTERPGAPAPELAPARQPGALPTYWPQPTAAFPQPAYLPAQPAPSVAPEPLPQAAPPVEAPVESAEAPLEPIGYYPTLAPALPVSPADPEAAPAASTLSGGTYSTRAGRSTRKIL